MKMHTAEWHTSTKQHSITSHDVIFIRTSISCPIIKCNTNPKPNIKLSHATRTSNIVSDCHMQQEPQISYQTVICNKNLIIFKCDIPVVFYKYPIPHIRLSHAPRSSNLTSGYPTKQKAQILYQTVTCN